MTIVDKTHDPFSIKEKAISFLQLVAKGKVREAYIRYVDDCFCHHNPFFKGDSQSLMLAMEEDAAQNPNKLLEVKQVVSEGDTVVVHSYMRQHQESLGVALVHIFRFHEGNIVELWDIGQPIPKQSPNENGPF
ncbi:polyketide cyclase [Pullulanibacillus pueri]|uniref:Polyketide cyclase n=1 Tax=Pullulanibacillus pueri TaxID=1437324 RepID=A0A8J2ZY59_9BACL|nr:nuclear transport factor 2 family protein [Pullulanibacillus pueri]GGH86213.1 polyketide cyclase [Pullulanibacillus pueri]